MAKKKAQPKKKSVIAKADNAKGGRQNTFSLTLAAAICDLVADGLALPAICRLENMPCRAAVYHWLAIGDKDPESDHGRFVDLYARAREMRAELMADEFLDIVDDSRNDYMLKTDEDGTQRVTLDAENIQRSRLRADARKWLMAKIAPRKYGDKVEHSHGGTDGGAIKHEHSLTATMSPEEAAQAYKRFMRGQG